MAESGAVKIGCNDMKLRCIWNVLQKWGKKFTPGDFIALMALLLSLHCEYQMRVDQRFTGNGNVSYTNCTITHPQNSEMHGYPDHVLAKLSSSKLRDGTFNYLKLTEKTVLEFPEDDQEYVLDMMLQIDVGSTMYPIGIDTGKWHFECLSYENDFLQGATNSHMHLYISVAGQTEVDGKKKRNLLISSNVQKHAHNRWRNKFGRIKSDRIIEYAPVALVLHDITWWNATEAMYREAGYKPLRSECPKDTPNGYYYANMGWKDAGDEIIQCWELRKIENPPPTYEELKMMMDDLSQRFLQIEKGGSESI